MGKERVKVCLCFFLTVDFTEMFLSSPLPNMGPADKRDLTTFCNMLSNTYLKSVKNHGN